MSKPQTLFLYLQKKPPVGETGYDIVLVGSGLGSLLCAALLGKHGYRVCVLEKNRQFGGCLQSFAREKQVFDSGVHYMGSLAPGETLYQVFKYAEIADDLPLEKMDEAVFDRIVFLDDQESYDQAQGYARFIETLVPQFPEEADAIRRYCEQLQSVCRHFAYYHLAPGQGLADKQPVLDLTLKDGLASLTSNTRLQEVLAGNNLLYAGDASNTPFYVHALVVNSYLQSAWKCRDGGSQITRRLVKTIRRYGGMLHNHAEVVSLEEKDGIINAAVLKNGERITGNHFISNLHPQQTLALTGSKLLRPLYRQRINALKNTISSFCVYLTIQPGTMRYEKHNYYLHTKNGVWEAIQCDPATWPQTLFVFFGAGQQQQDATTITLMTYMPYDWVQPWADSFNTDAAPADRGESYTAFKKEMEQKMIDMAARQFPELPAAIQSINSASPLSYRDYIGTADGSLYGIAKDAHNPLGSFVSARTKIPNLYLTGQNLLMHGLLGVSLAALQTCSAFVNETELLEKIRHA